MAMECGSGPTQLRNYPMEDVSSGIRCKAYRYGRELSPFHQKHGAHKIALPADFCRRAGFCQE
jgi:hypothetical protein